jgi:hypothetical protein
MWAGAITLLKRQAPQLGFLRVVDVMRSQFQSVLRLVSGTALIFVLVGGCRPGDSSGKSGHENRPSEKSLIPLRVVVADKDQAAVPFPSLQVAGCPANEVRRRLREAEEAYAADEQRLHNALQDCRTKQTSAEHDLDHEKTVLEQEYNAAVPRGEDNVVKSRNPLAELSKARAVKSAVDEQYKAALRSRIAPLEASLDRAKQAVAAAEADLERLRDSFNDRLFASLPGRPEKTWKTNKEGQATLAMVRNEPWYVWASGEREVSTRLLMKGKLRGDGNLEARIEAGGFEKQIYRWLMLIPDDLDASGELSLDQSNLFDGRAIVRSLGAERSDSPQLRN